MNEPTAADGDTSGAPGPALAAGAVLGVAGAAAALAVAAAAEVPGLRPLRSAAPARSSPGLRVTGRVTARQPKAFTAW
ncbi:hypothetical protein ABZ177_14050 [Streptomyces sp. NPDC006284]|uniref:hypothetical protein n=1 Tax=Streptomyces sp. NPDC006284 TaxID=3156742 RepID=UPI0033AAE9E5